ncbi:MAG: restriction endonuclease subunit S [Burkholderiaceae bacterium]|nr:restriction endonuclease subunit S [Burkholderiaceae bacterium]
MKQAWPLVRLGDVLLRHKDGLDIEEEEEYTRLTIRMNGQGVGVRDKVCGREIGTKRQFRVKAGQFLLSKIDARNGAFGLVPNDCDEAIVTGNFWAFDISSDRVVPRFIELLTKTTLFVDYSIKASSGTTNRLYLQEEKFAEQQIELPPIEEQIKIVARIDAVQQRMQAADKLRVSIDREIASLLAVRFQETLTHAKWLPMNEVAPIVRRDVTVNHQSNYAELGIRSFGKGTFHKPTLSGLELGDKRVYRIEPGDLLFSNVFAWEGAIAVAQPEDSGRVGSHRFISCVPHDGLTTAEYLRYYFLTDAGMTKIRDASPGGAGRNRTLGLSKLMDLDVPIPSIEVRKSFVDLLRLMNASRLIRGKELSENESVVPALVKRLMA